MASYEKARVKLTNIQLSKLKSETKNKTRAALGTIKSWFSFA